MKYRNPILPGFYPDPSVCRVGEDYYLVTSSFEYFPGVPIFHSRDLVNWRQIGHCLTRPSQLPLEKSRFSGGIFAPTLRYHDGRFYMITTNTSHGGNFLVHAEDPAGEWSEPVWINQEGIDPSLLFDDDGSVYFTGTGITQFRIDPMTGEILSDKKVISKGTGGRFPEGPHLYRIGKWYYLMIAEGGTEYGHMETIARSRDPFGPFEFCPHNPILSHRSVLSPIQCTGHADLLADHLGRWWMVCLGVRPEANPPCHHLGRETFLAPVRWTDDGWPVVGDHGRIAMEMEADLLPPCPWPEQPARDEFDGEPLAMAWNFLRNPRAEDWSLTDRPGFLRLNGSAVTLDEEDSPAFVGRRQQHFGCAVRTLLEFAPSAENEEAGLTVYMNPTHHYDLAIRGRRVVVRRRIGSLVADVAEAPAPEGPVELGVDADRQAYRFLLNGKQLAEGETRYLSTEVAKGFTGVYLGMYATGHGRPCNAPADFDWFEYRPTEAEQR